MKKLLLVCLLALSTNAYSATLTAFLMPNESAMVSDEKIDGLNLIPFSANKTYSSDFIYAWNVKSQDSSNPYDITRIGVGFIIKILTFDPISKHYTAQVSGDSSIRLLSHRKFKGTLLNVYLSFLNGSQKDQEIISGNLQELKKVDDLPRINSLNPSDFMLSRFKDEIILTTQHMVPIVIKTE